MKNLRTSWWISAAVVAATCVVSLGKPPDALDRLPGNISAAVVVRDLAGINQKADSLLGALGPGGPGEFFKQALALPGLDADGSMAVLTTGDIEDEDAWVVLLPVSDYKALARFGGATGSGEPETVELIDMVGTLRNANGYAAFASTPQGLAAIHEAPDGAPIRDLIGPMGLDVADSADVLLIATPGGATPVIDEARQQFNDQFAMIAAMAGQGALNADEGPLDGAVRAFEQDGRAAVVGLAITDGAVMLDLAVQFADGSQWATTFASGGDSSTLLSRLPTSDYLLALAVDTHSDVGRRMMAGKGGAVFSPLLASVQGVSVVMGPPPGMMGGMLVNTIAYLQTTQPDALLEQMHSTLTGLDEAQPGENVPGVTFSGDFQAGATSLDEHSVDAWQVKVDVDPDDMAAQQATAPLGIMFGPAGGPGGYVTTAGNALLVTLGRNSRLMGSALKTAGAKAGPIQGEQMRTTAATLPPRRFFESYLNPNAVLAILAPMAPMIGLDLGIDPEQTPAMPPIALSVSSGGGGVRGRLSVPIGVVKIVQDLGGNQDKPDNQKENSGQPRF